MTTICDELTKGDLPYLIPTPNSTSEEGANKDRFLLNPCLKEPQELSYFRFIGIHS